MLLIDLNVLLYAINTASPSHRPARAWLERTLSGASSVAFAWVVILGFLRLATSRRVFERPMSPEEAFAVVDGWLARPNVVLLAPGSAHWRILRTLLAESGAAGNLTTDTHLAALAIEHDCELCSTDADFGRFSRLQWHNPLR